MLYLLTTRKDSKNNAEGASFTEEILAAGQNSATGQIFETVQIFTFTADRLRRYQGAWHYEKKNLFPGCAFLQCDPSEGSGLADAGLVLRQFFRQFYDLIYRPLSPETEQLLWELGGPRHHLSMSRGVIRGGRTQVIEGPLQGKERMIIRIDRHKRLACLSDRFLPVVFQAGLEITEKRGEEEDFCRIAAAGAEPELRKLS